MIAVTARARHTLERRRRALRALYAENEGERRRLEAEPEVDFPDRALAEESRTLLSRLSDGEQAELNEIEAALRRMERGVWGKCEECSEPIEYGRLVALPEARKCVGCSGADLHAAG